MTSRNPLLFLVLTIWSLDAISGASFSNVIVRRGSDVLPIEYINYNPSALTYTSQVARLSQAPLQSVISEPLAASVISPCVSPCVIPNAAPIHSTPNAKIVAYKASAPSVPVVLSKDEARGYQYAYAVFDENTGDKKTQSEHSDGSVVQGHYSFIQPDGFLREVVYTADDLKGFNAVVRNLSPGPEHQHPAETEKEKQEKKPSLPCPNPKNEHLTHKHESHEEVIPVKQEHLEIEHLEENKNKAASAEKVNEHSGENSIEKGEEKPEDHSHEDKSHEDKHHEEKPHEEVQPNLGSEEGNEPNVVISYNDIIKCLQSKLHGSQSAVSPLTYVLLPSSYKPC